MKFLVTAFTRQKSHPSPDTPGSDSDRARSRPVVRNRCASVGLLRRLGFQATPIGYTSTAWSSRHGAGPELMACEPTGHAGRGDQPDPV